jgi:arylsulfatase A
MMLTHDPFQPTPDSAGWNPKARGEAGSDPRHFADMVAYMDKQVGSLVAKLEELRLREKTLIVFFGDNGTLRNVTSVIDGRPLRGGKGSPTRAGMRVPLILNRPGAIPAGQVRDDLADSTDLFATILRAAGVPLPEPCDGRDLLSGGPPREWIYCWYSKDGARAEAEFAFDARHKLARTGRLFDDETALPDDALPDVRRRLQAGLDKFKGLR